MKIPFKPLILCLSISFLSNSISYAGGIKLDEENWNQETKKRLDILLNKNANKGKKIIFDFDNTMVSRDIGEATFAFLVKDGMINKEKIKSFSPSFFLDGKEFSLDKVIDLTDYYEKFIMSTEHHKNDDSAAINSYAWMVQAMEGLTPFDVISATKKGFMNNQAKNDRKLAKETTVTITENKTSYMIPFFHPEIVDLIGKMILNGYDLYFVSASNVWTIRYMVTVELARLISQKFKKEIKISPEKVIGVSTLLKDKRTGILY